MSRRKEFADLVLAYERELALTAAQRNRDIQRARFEGGTALGLEVIEAQRALARARLSLAQALVRYNVEQLRLVAATGHLTPDAVER